MADVAWEEMQCGESSKKAAITDRILRKAEQRKSVEKKRKAALKKKTRKTKEAPPPPPEPEVAPETAAATPPPPPETAVTLLRRLGRAVQQLGDERAPTRGEGLATLKAVLDGPAPLPEATVAELLHTLCRPLLRRFEDPVERHREAAIRLVTTLCRKVSDVGPHLPYLFPMLHGRGSPAVGLDIEQGTFVFDLAEHEAYKRGKAMKRPDLACAFERERTLSVREPSEELRVLLCDLLLVVTLDRPPSIVARYLHESLLLLAGFSRDTFGDLASRAADGIAKVCAIEALQAALVPYAAALARVSMPNLRHRHARVRRAAVVAVRRSVAVKHTEKCRGAGTGAIVDLVGFREDNVIPTAAFYGAETRYNYVAELTRDASATVRLALCEAFAEWFTVTADRRDIQPRLLAYLLNFGIDKDAGVRAAAAAAIEVGGRELMSEGNYHDQYIEKMQYGVDGDPRGNHDPEGLPWPYEKRPTLGSRMMVRCFAHRFVQPVMDELGSWNEDARAQSCILLSTIFVHCEENMTEKLAKVVISLVKALSRTRHEGFGDGHRNGILECARVLGRYVVPESFVPFLAPRVAGDLEVVPGGAGVDAREDVAAILEAFLRGAKPAAVLPHVNALVDVLTHPLMVESEVVSLRTAALSTLSALLEIVVGRGRSALESVFVATGRLESLDAALNAVLRAVLAWRHGAPAAADAALALLARADAAVSHGGGAAGLVLKRAPKLFPKLTEALEDAEATDSRVLCQALLLADASVDQGDGLVALLDLGARAAAAAVDAFMVKNLGGDDAFADEGAAAAHALAEALATPLKAAEAVAAASPYFDEIIRRATADLVRNVVLAPEAAWAGGGRGRVALVSALATPALVDRVHLRAAAENCARAVIAPTRSFESGHREAKAYALRCLDTLATLLEACVADPAAKRRTAKPFADRTDADALEPTVLAAARAARKAADRLLSRDDEAIKRGATKVLWEVMYALEEEDYEPFLDALLVRSANDYPEDYVDDAATQVDALLRAAAVLDPKAFIAAVQSAAVLKRTNVLCSLEDHAEMILAMRKP